MDDFALALLVDGLMQVGHGIVADPAGDLFLIFIAHDDDIVNLKMPFQLTTPGRSKLRPPCKAPPWPRRQL